MTILDTVETINFPPWARDLTNPDFGAIRRGVEYFVDPKILELILDEANPVTFSWGAIGPRIFFGRDHGPYIPYSPTTVDENFRCQVRERDWPWRWGDEIWVFAVWQQHPIYLHWIDSEMGSIRLFAPGEFAEAKEFVARRAAADSGDLAASLPVGWTRKTYVPAGDDPIKQLARHWRDGNIVVKDGPFAEEIRALFMALEARYR